LTLVAEVAAIEKRGAYVVRYSDHAANRKRFHPLDHFAWRH